MDSDVEDSNSRRRVFTGNGPLVVFFLLLGVTVLLGVGALIMAALQGG